MVEQFAEKVVMPMDELPDEESLAFWLHWKEECEVYELQKQVLKCIPGGIIDFHLKKNLCAWNRRHVKPRALLVKYINKKHSKAQFWRGMREKMRWIMKHECERYFHWGYCRCSKCLKMYYVKGEFTMIIVRIKDRIFDLRQFGDEARNYLINMISKEELNMVTASKNKESITKVLSRPRSLYLCQKYNYSQDVVESMKLAQED